MFDPKQIIQINNNLFEIPKSFRSDMRVSARFYASKDMIDVIVKDRSLEQLVNVTTLKGIVNFSVAMPDIHEGYGFPIGGVAATLLPEGLISPGGVGYDINCGMRVLKTDLSHEDIKDKLENLMTQFQRDIPSGVGRGGGIVLNEKDIDEVLNTGVSWAVKNKYATEHDQNHTEEFGHMKSADASKVSDKAKKRGRDQLGTLGSGNHFLEVQKIIQIFDEKTAATFGLKQDQVIIMIHTGSRGLGHQVATDYIRLMDNALEKYKITIPDRELVSVPFNSKEGQNYYKAMSAAANFAWTNRQIITYYTRRAWKQFFPDTPLTLLYDVAHNMAKQETHIVKKTETKLCVHRKGATRSFPAGHPDLFADYQKTGQPVIIPGSMGTFSYILVGTEESMKQAWGSVNHGAGRRLSRKAAKKQILESNISLKKQLEQQGIIVRARSAAGLAEEAPLAYKDIDNVVNVVAEAGLAKKVVKLKPLGVLKGD